MLGFRAANLSRTVATTSCSKGVAVRFRLAFSLLTLCVSAYAQNPTPISRVIPEVVTVHRDLVYASYENREMLLDLYLPAVRSEMMLPAIVVIRGGGWAQGDKEGFGPMAAALAKRGFAAASIEYRASGEAVFPAAVEDTKAAVRWMRANAATYELDPDSIGAIGGSAGAHLALFLDLTADIREFEGDGGNANLSSAVSAVVGFATPGDLGVMSGSQAAAAPLASFLGATFNDDPDLWEAASPSTYIRPESPPSLLIQSEADNVVPFKQSVQLTQRMAAAGVPVELVLISGAPHSFWNFEQWFDDSMNRAASFFRAHLSQ